jgi:nucleotide-binding universal stress UspA family protein
MKILFGTDGSRYALSAARFLSHWLPGPGIEVDLVSVIPGSGPDTKPGYRKPTSLKDRRGGEAGRWQEATAEPLTSKGHQVNGLVRQGVASRVLTRMAEEGDYDLVVVGAKGRSDTPHLTIGSVALAVLENAPSSALMVREREPKLRGKQLPSRMRPFSLMLPTDGRVHSFQASRRFFQLFQIENLEVDIVTVLQGPQEIGSKEPSRSERERLHLEAERAARVRLHATENELAGNPSLVRSEILRGDPAEEVVRRAAENRADLLVLGSRDDRSPEGRRLGSVALEIARAAPCSVLVVRGS